MLPLSWVFSPLRNKHNCQISVLLQVKLRRIQLGLEAKMWSLLFWIKHTYLQKPVSQTSNCRPVQTPQPHAVLSKGRTHSSWIQRTARSPLFCGKARMTVTRTLIADSLVLLRGQFLFDGSQGVTNEGKMVSSTHTLFHLILAAALWYTCCVSSETYKREF